MRAGLLALFVALLAAPSASAKSIGFNVHQSLDTGVPVTPVCGGTIVRIDFNWFQAEPKQGTYDWALFDGLINGARAKGLTVLATIGYTPAWASRANVDGKDTLNDVPKAGHYEAFVKAAVGRYKDRVQHWELWNEPNLGEFFEGTAQEYVDLVLKPGAKAVHAVCPACKTLGPDIATVGKEYANWMKTTLSQALSDIDIISGHVYSDFPKPGDTTSDSFFTKLEAHRVLKLGTTVIYEDPLSLREAIVANGGGSKPFWLTETGRKAKFGDTAAMDAQAVYVRKVLEAQLARPWWETTIFYEAFDEPGTTYDFGFTLRDPKAAGGFQQKPACALVAKAAAQQPAFGGKGTDCSDGLDNEGDGKIDLGDPDCFTASTKSEGLPPPPPVDAGVDDDAGATDAGSDGGAQDLPAGDPGGCGCTTPGSSATAPWLWLLALALVGARRGPSRSA